MLNSEIIQANKMTYLNLISELRIDMTELVTWLDSVNYFEKPYSSQHIGAYKGGLCEHALRVYYELIRLVSVYAPDKYTKEDLAKVALFKDIYKAPLYESYFRNIKNPLTGIWEQEEAFKMCDTRPVFGDLGFSSYMIAKQFISFTDEQTEAICYSSLGMENGFKTFDIYGVLENYKLVTLVHFAELAVNYLY